MPSIPVRNFGKHGDQVSVLGLGGHHLGDAEDEQTADHQSRSQHRDATGCGMRLITEVADDVGPGEATQVPEGID